jgi:tryptophan synthase beta chain
LPNPAFEEEFRNLLRDYVGRPTPLYFAGRLSQKYNTNVYLKREDLCHTGAHKVNNTIGQISVAKRLGKKRIVAGNGGRPARRRHRHRMRPDGHGMHRVHGQARH